MSDTDRTYECPDCGRQITIGTKGTEYGHQRGVNSEQPRCPRRPASVDPDKPSKSARWRGDEQGGEPA